MEPKYFKEKKSTYGVYFELHAEQEVKKNSNTGCFSELTYSPIDAKWKSVLIKEPINIIPYEPREIKRWLRDLNELGFPCHFEGIDEHLKIRLVLKEFKSKPHLSSTLMLIRLLWEMGMNKIPDIYFQVMDANPNANKFIQLQKAHKHPSLMETTRNYGHGYTPPPYPTFNTNHTVTSHRQLQNISRAELFKRLKAGKSVWAIHEESIEKTWTKGARI